MPSTLSIPKETPDWQSLLDDTEAARNAAQDARDDALSAAAESSFVNAGNYVEGNITGGGAIQEAVNDLSPKSGTVFVPADGPDDGVPTSGKNIAEDGVWAIEEEIEINDPGVSIIGEGLGSSGNSQEVSRGTVLLTPDSAQYINSMLYFDFCAGCSVQSLRMDGGTASTFSGNAKHCIEINDNDPQRTLVTFRIFNSYIEHSDISGVRVNAKNGRMSSLHISMSQLVDFAGQDSSAVKVESATDFFSMTIGQSLFSLLGHIIDVHDKMNNIQVNSCGSGAGQSTGFSAFRIRDEVDSLSVSQFDEFRFQNALLKVDNGASLFGGNLDNINIEGDGVQSNIIDNQGTIEELAVNNIDYQGIAGTPYLNMINSPSNAPRCTFNGLGYNGADNPSSAGPWNGNGKEGVKVFFSNANGDQVAEYINGDWFIRSV